jgi:hypothetical protein
LPKTFRQSARLGIKFKPCKALPREQATTRFFKQLLPSYFGCAIIWQLSIVLPLSVRQRSHELICYLDREFMAFEMKLNAYVDLKSDPALGA